MVRIMNCKFKHDLDLLIHLCILTVVIISDIRGSTASHIPSDFIIHSRHRRERDCARTEFQCRDRTCLPSTIMCDGVKDCPDGSDEILATCSEMTCPQNTFRCAYGACVDGDKKCNGEQDCADNSDELLEECPGFSWLQPGVRNKCKKYEFQCRSGDCISSGFVCDGKKDCPDGSDETITKCITLARCPSYLFRCAYGACIELSAKCDGQIDCADGSDEDAFLCNRTLPSVQHTTVPSPITPPPTASSGPSSNECQLPEKTEGVKFDKKTIASGFIKVSCEDDYHLETEFKWNRPEYITLLCRDGQWSSDHPYKCRKRCKPLRSPSATYECVHDNNKVDCNSPVLPGTEANEICVTGYKKNRNWSPRNRCSENGSWEGDPYTCIEECGLIHDGRESKPLISNADEATVSEFPWNVAIYEKKANTSMNLICGGTLIKAYIALTAAHCVTEKDSYNKRKLTIAVGKYYRDWNNKTEFVQTREISENNIFFSDNYMGRTNNFKSDIALTYMDPPVKLNTGVVPICLPTPSMTINNNENGTVVGWGKNEHNVDSKIIQSGVLHYISRPKCLELFTKNIPEDKFCTHTPDKTSSDVQSGDSGAGLVFRKSDKYYIFGIVSTSVADEIGLSAFTNITHPDSMKFLEEIKNLRNKLYRD